MKTYNIHIKCESADELKSELIELTAIMAGLRTTTKKWQREFGSNNRNNMKYWEQKADAWIKKHKILNQTSP